MRAPRLVAESDDADLSPGSLLRHERPVLLHVRGILPWLEPRHVSRGAPPKRLGATPPSRTPRAAPQRAAASWARGASCLFSSLIYFLLRSEALVPSVLVFR